MLTSLSIQNYALIENIDISFSPQLNIITGETGAGKSIILGALGLILGQRAEGKYFYQQEKKCVVEGYFKIKDYALHDFFSQHQLSYDDQTVLRREISIDGKSRAFINDELVTLQILKQLGEQLVNIHSQHASMQLNEEKFQLLVVDTLAGNQPLLRQYQKTYKLYQEELKRLETLKTEHEQAKLNFDYIQFQYEELDKAALVMGEQAQLEQELSVLSHAEEIKRNLMESAIRLDGHEQAVLLQLKNSLLLLKQIASYSPKLEQLSAQLESAWIEIKDLAFEIDRLHEQTSVDENRLAQINERLHTLYSLQQKHHVDGVEGLINMHTSLAQKLNAVNLGDEEIERLESAIKGLWTELDIIADKLSASRNAAISTLADKINELLVEVGLPYAQVVIQNTRLAEGVFRETGRDQLTFLFSANKGQKPAPLQQVASGGELSRLMLCLKFLVARHTALPTIVFDEIDIGISGAIALKVGGLMEKLSGYMQVITITHLPQIACKGDRHYRVYKNEEDAYALTKISLLSYQDRIQEIAKMASGDHPGAFALQHAEEMLQGNVKTSL